MDIESSVKDESLTVYGKPKELTVTTLPQNDPDEAITETNPIDPMESDFDHTIDLLDGYKSMITREELTFAALNGSEAYTLSVMKLHGFAGTESWVDTIKKAAETFYKTIKETLKAIKDYFLGDGAKQVEEAGDRAKEAVVAMAELDHDAPIPDESKVRNPLSYFKGIQESVDLEELFKEYPNVKAAMDKIQTTVGKVKESDTVAKLGGVYQEMRTNAASAADAITQAIQKALSNAEKSAEEVRKVNPSPVEDSPKEVQDGFKEEHKQNVEKAKEETKRAKALSGMRTKITSLLNSITSNAGAVKTEKKESAFKG